MENWIKIDTILELLKYYNDNNIIAMSDENLKHWLDERKVKENKILD